MNVFKNISHHEFFDPSFSTLMQNRIRKVLLICSHYDAFLLEEDGRIDEQIFNEYVSQNLRFPPSFTIIHSAAQAFEKLKNEPIDLIIEMLNIGDSDPFHLAQMMKRTYPQVPIVVLTHFSREVSMKLQNEDLSGIDYVFCWLGNPDLLLAIIKLLEDRMNVKHDVEETGVQVILLVEDSIRFVSTVLPHIYKILFFQSRELGKEALNEHQRMLRMRARPKVLLAGSFEEAVLLYEKYKDNLLGIISDISFLKEGKKDPEAGFKLVEYVRASDPYLPFILQSSNLANKERAEAVSTHFLYKFSKNLSHELKEYILSQFGFGAFIFRNPSNHKEIARATDLQDFQHKLLEIPDETLIYHTNRNDFSKWLNARGLFSIGNLLKPLTNQDFKSLNEARYFVYNAISRFRSYKGRGIIARFDKDRFDEYLTFSRIGEGSVGGKARGLAFIDHFLQKHNLYDAFPGVRISIPRSVAISVDYFDRFMEENNLYEKKLMEMDDEAILSEFIKASLPSEVTENLAAFIKTVKNPLAVRSSSKLEDSFFQPFAGIYTTYMIPVVSDMDKTITLLTQAIKCVYASVFYCQARSFISATSNLIDEEKMGVIVQEVCGHRYKDFFYPVISGVARSVNYYPSGKEKPEDGTAQIAFGLGRSVVEGNGYCIRFSPNYPKKILQLQTPASALKFTQKYFYALHLDPQRFYPSTNDAVNLEWLPVESALHDKTFRFAASFYDYQDNSIKEQYIENAQPVITFSQILQHNQFPLAEILQVLLKIGEQEMNNPVEIEFAVNPEKNETGLQTFHVLQIRPVIQYEQKIQSNFGDIENNKVIVVSPQALGNGIYKGITDLLWVKPEKYNSLVTKKIADEIGWINHQLSEQQRNYILIGPGRWGTRDPFLGIPVNWAQISNAMVIVEICPDNQSIEPSQGTHFFQNLTAFGVGYLTIKPSSGQGFIDEKFLSDVQVINHAEYIRHIRFDSPALVVIDGRSSRGVILKPT